MSEETLYQASACVVSHVYVQVQSSLQLSLMPSWTISCVLSSVFLEELINIHREGEGE